MGRLEDVKKALIEEKLPQKRPLGVTIIAILGIIGSLLSILAAMSIFVIGDISYTITYSEAGVVTTGDTPIENTIFFMILGVVGIVGNVLLLKMNRKGFYIVLITIAINIALLLPTVQNIIANLNVFSNAVGLAIALAYFLPVTVYLWKKRQLFT